MHFFKSQLKIALVTAVLIGLAPQSQAFDRAKLLQSFFSIVMIKGYTADGSMAYGSGVVVGPNKIVTNCHIFRKTPEPFVSRGEDTYRITQVQADRYYDICLVGTEQTPFQAAEIGSVTQMKKGEEIIGMGHSSGNPSPVNANGALKSVYPFNHAYIIRSSARFTMGASGSGLFDSQGRLIGINTFKSPGRNAYFYALPIEWLANVEKQPIETKFPIEGKTFWEEDDEQKPYFMQIATPELNEDWGKLAAISEKWTKAEPHNDEAWYELGNAMDHLNKKSDAETAYRRAIQINKGHTEALYALGLIALNKGNQKEAKEIKLAILDIDPELSEALDKEIIKSEK
jgi:tetratricopeptide (TPR) repeat protein